MFISLLSCLSIIIARNAGKIEFLELAAYDFMLRIRADDFAPDPRIVLITITEDDIQSLKEWPLTDASLARLLSAVKAAGPRAIGLDIYRDMPVPPGQEELTELFRGNDNIVTVQKIGDSLHPGVPPPYMVEDAGLVGFADYAPDREDTVRRGILFLDDGTQAYNSFSLLLSLIYLGHEGVSAQPDEGNPEHLRIGATTFVPFEPDDGGYMNADAKGYQFFLDFHGAGRPFRSYTLQDVLNGKMDPAHLRDKVVLIGVTAESVKDYFATPVTGYRGYSREMFGVELHAHIVSQILRYAFNEDRPLRPIRESYEWIIIVFWGFVGGALGLWMRSLPRFMLSVGACLSVIFLTADAAFLKGWWVPSVPPGISFFISSALVTALMAHREKTERSNLMQIFSKHVSQDIAEAIWQQRDQIMEHGRPLPQKLTATVLFSDLKGFTTISEKLDPAELMDWLNEYMEAMAQIIIDHGGVINKYIGDAIMGIFGVPIARSDDQEIRRDAVNAVDAAVHMGRALEELNRTWRTKNRPTTGMRIGIFTGPLVAGSLGSSKRMEYTVIGDTVNISSRLESYKRPEGEPPSEDKSCRVLIGEATLKYIGDRYETERIGEVSLKGKQEKITIYQVKERREEPAAGSSFREAT